MITNFTILPMMKVLGGLVIRDLLKKRGSEEITVGEDVLEGPATLQLKDVGTATRAVMRATTKAFNEARSTPTSTLSTETEAGTAGHKDMAQPPRASQTKASPVPPVLTKCNQHQTQAQPLSGRTARLL